MKTPIITKQPSSVDKAMSDDVIANWSEAITNLHGYHHQFVTCISQKAIEHELIREKTTYIGQCPMGQLVKLIRTMQTELANLTREVDQVESLKQFTTQQVCNQLANHTLRLNQLNDQAQTRLYLIKQSAS